MPMCAGGAACGRGGHVLHQPGGQEVVGQPRHAAVRPRHGGQRRRPRSRHIMSDNVRTPS